MGEALTLPSAEGFAGDGPPSSSSGALPSCSSGASTSVAVASVRLILAVATRGVLGLLGLPARRRLLAFADDHGYRLADRHIVALAGDDLLEDAGVLGGQLHRRLVGLDLG